MKLIFISWAQQLNYLSFNIAKRVIEPGCPFYRYIFVHTSVLAEVSSPSFEHFKLMMALLYALWKLFRSSQFSFLFYIYIYLCIFFANEQS